MKTTKHSKFSKKFVIWKLKVISNFRILHEQFESFRFLQAFVPARFNKILAIFLWNIVHYFFHKPQTQWFISHPVLSNLRFYLDYKSFCRVQLRWVWMNANSLNLLLLKEAFSPSIHMNRRVVKNQTYIV